MGAGLFDLRSLSTQTLEGIYQSLVHRFGEPEDRLYWTVTRILRERDAI